MHLYGFIMILITYAELLLLSGDSSSGISRSRHITTWRILIFLNLGGLWFFSFFFKHFFESLFYLISIQSDLKANNIVLHLEFLMMSEYLFIQFLTKWSNHSNTRAFFFFLPIPLMNEMFINCLFILSFEMEATLQVCCCLNFRRALCFDTHGR